MSKEDTLIRPHLAKRLVKLGDELKRWESYLAYDYPQPRKTFREFLQELQEVENDILAVIQKK